VPSLRIITLEEHVSPTNQKHEVVQQRQVSLEPITKEQFLREKRPAHSTTTSPLPTHQSHQLKTHTESPTPRDRLNLESLPHH